MSKSRKPRSLVADSGLILEQEVVRALNKEIEVEKRKRSAAELRAKHAEVRLKDTEEKLKKIASKAVKAEKHEGGVKVALEPCFRHSATDNSITARGYQRFQGSPRTNKTSIRGEHQLVD